ncbi:putative manganese-dependent inorganic diphosphatase [Laedolimicola ammoniilytica]|uniref:inorganic diphosphatase n=1 Tax=Laedolimicola ammoniilytica TaxID=2981771 RepID=A0ABT2S0Q9_9FIRM|nr:putative manganese-dependent inorganic diphosphatase [Laedolimicola ammoniilytica]MBD9157412.1 putative manganese-dependent inorganic diphosphatase [Lachnospiraceae bacterium]MCU6698175.1 putative manganese-dependent inorganic diphosphatase [Laedolimicola ammoniilytica]SCH14252.1 Manganese-dependent inorganic pyrophosphatase [uncultured Clostridium sp.]SCI66844.1 Manganese-dependent inorganic pyrophosphatase [uncultured Clostridium sp.]
MEKDNTRPVYIIGHKNPDTDSICSALAYAYLKNTLEGGGYIAARAGQLNQETQYVLNYFQAEAPVYVADVMTQVKDIEIRKTEGVQGNLSLKQAWNLMRRIGAVTLPITKDQKIEGLITIGDIATSYMDVLDSKILAQANTQYRNIIDTLEGTILVGSAEDYYNKGKVLIAAANPDLMEDYIEEGDLVILGNRYESQLCAIEMRAGCIIVCEGAKVSMTIKKLAQEHHCVVISTPHDTFTAARLINQSMPIRYFMKSDNLTIFNVNEKTDDIKEIMGQKRYRDFPIVDKDDNYIGMISRRNLLNLKRKQVIMVDHNEESQAVDGIDHAEILEIIDHHRLGTLETMSPVFFRNQPLGCTATIMYQMYQERGVEIPKKIAGLLCSAIISDTLMFRSPTCTAIDKAAAENLAQIAGIDIEDLAVDMFSAGSNLGSRTAEEIFYQDFKRFDVGNVEFGVGQINSMNAVELEEIREKLIPYLPVAHRESGLNMIFFMLTNIIKESTELLCYGPNSDTLVKEAFQLPDDGDTYELKGLVSRKKQLIPSLAGMIQQMEEMR